MGRFALIPIRQRNTLIGSGCKIFWKMKGCLRTTPENNRTGRRQRLRGKESAFSYCLMSWVCFLWRWKFLEVFTVNGGPRFLLPLHDVSHNADCRGLCSGTHCQTSTNGRPNAGDNHLADDWFHCFRHGPSFFCRWCMIAPAFTPSLTSDDGRMEVSANL